MQLNIKKEVKEYKNDSNRYVPLVSIIVVTYQHVNYIKECLEGVINQVTNFKYEIILGEDDSTDGTREICLEYAKKYPNKIRLFLHHRENVIYISGKPTGRFNFLYNLSKSRGKYIALCEGDDYWTDPYKLQKQVDFLENNPDYVICFHNVTILDENKKIFYNDFITRKVNETTDIYDLAKGNYIHTPSVVFRNILNFEMLSEFINSYLPDYFLYMLLAQYGKIIKLQGTMAVYRIHAKGIWSVNKNQNEIIIKNLNLMIKYFKGKDFNKILKKRRNRFFLNKFKFFRFLKKIKQNLNENNNNSCYL